MLVIATPARPTIQPPPPPKPQEKPFELKVENDLKLEYHKFNHHKHTYDEIERQVRERWTDSRISMTVLLNKKYYGTYIDSRSHDEIQVWRSIL